MTQPHVPPPIPGPVLGYQGPGSVQCPKCGNPNSKKVSFTWWGGALGPRMFNHVKCLGCGSCYNGKTGQPNTNAIILYVVISSVLAIILLIVFAKLR